VLFFNHYIKKLFPDKSGETANIFFFPLERLNVPFLCPNTFLLIKILGKNDEVQHIVQRSGEKVALTSLAVVIRGIVLAGCW